MKKKTKKKNKKIIISIICIILIILAIVLFLIFNKDRGTYTIETMYIKNSDNQRIFTQVYKPKHKGKMPVVIYSHGLGATYRACSDYAESLVKYNIVSVCMDFRGGSDRSKSDGRTTDMSFLTEMEDLDTIIEEVKTWKYIDTSNIILMGSSQGGAISALLSADREDIKGTVLLYPALGIPSVVTKWYSSKEAIPEEVKMTSKITVGPKYFLDIWDLDVYSIIAKDKKQILILQGTEDSLVSPEHSKKVNDIYENSELYFIEGAGHGFEGEQLDEAMVHIIDYLKKIEVIK